MPICPTRQKGPSSQTHDNNRTIKEGYNDKKKEPNEKRRNATNLCIKATHSQDFRFNKFYTALYIDFIVYT